MSLHVDRAHTPRVVVVAAHLFDDGTPQWRREWAVADSIRTALGSMWRGRARLIPRGDIRWLLSGDECLNTDCRVPSLDSDLTAVARLLHADALVVVDASPRADRGAAVSAGVRRIDQAVPPKDGPVVTVDAPNALEAAWLVRRVLDAETTLWCAASTPCTRPVVAEPRR